MRRTDEAPGGPEAKPAADCVARFEVWPHRSLSRRGGVALLLATGLAAAFVAGASPLARALPAAAGMAVTVAALGLALRANNRAATVGETIEVGRLVTRVRRHGPGGTSTAAEFSTAWVRLSLTTDRRAAHRLALAEGLRRCPIGECLSPAERRSLAEALARSFAKARSESGAH